MAALTETTPTIFYELQSLTILNKYQTDTLKNSA